MSVVILFASFKIIFSIELRMSYPKIYLQIPHYNNAPYLQDCFDSVDALTYPNIAIHFFDDASNDNTEEVLKTISSSKIHLHKNPIRLGRVQNYQFAFSHCGDAEWFINLDSDDYYTYSSWIDEVMNVMNSCKDKNIQHIQTNFLCYVDASQIPSLRWIDENYALISGEDYLHYSIKHYAFSHLGSIFLASKLKLNGAYVDDCMHTDFMSAMRVAIQGNVLVGKKQIGLWRKHDGNQSDQRYNKAEYDKNNIAYYKLFEWCENFIGFKKLKTIIKTFEQREFEKKLAVAVDERRYSDALNSIRGEDNSLKKLGNYLYASLDENFKNIGSGILTRVLSLVVTFLSIPYFVKLLGVENYGWIGLYTTLVGAIYIFDFGLTSLITREISQQEDHQNIKTKSILATQEIVYWSIGLMMFLALYTIAPYVAKYWVSQATTTDADATQIVRYISLAVLAQWPHSFYTGAMFGLRQQHISNVTQFVFTLLKNIAGIAILSFYRTDIYIFFYWQIIISMGILVVQKAYLYRWLGAINPLKYFDISYFHQLKKMAIGLSIVSFFGFIYSDFANFILPKRIGLENFGYFNILFNIAIAMIMFCATVKGALFPKMSVEASQSNTDKTQYFINYSSIVSYVLFPISLFLCAFPAEILWVWFRDKSIVEKLTSPLPWITLGSLANSLMIVPWSYLIIKSNTKLLIFISGFLALISIPLMYFLTYKYGLNGACMYWFVINFPPMIILHYFFSKKYNIKLKSYWGQTIVVPILATMAIGSPLFVWVKNYDITPQGMLVGMIVSLSIIYIGLLIYKILKSKG